MWWTKSEQHLQKDVLFIEREKSENGNEEWWVKSWILAPNRLTKRVITKPFRVYKGIRKSYEDDSLYATVKLVKEYKDTFPVSYILKHNFGDRVVLILRGGFTVVLASTPPAIRETLHLDTFADFVSSYVVPAIYFTQEWVKDNGPEIASHGEEVLPILKKFGEQTCLALKFIWCKSQNVIFVLYAEAKPLAQRMFSDPEVKLRIRNAFSCFQRNVWIIAETIHECIPPEYIDYMMEHRWDIVAYMMELIKLIAKHVLQMIPLVAGRFYDVFHIYLNVIKVIISFIENNPVFLQYVKDILANGTALLSDALVSLPGLLPDIFAVIFKIVSSMQKLIDIFYPLLENFIDTHGSTLISYMNQLVKIVLPNVISVLQMLLSNESQNVVAEYFPIALEIMCRMCSFSKLSVKYSFYASRIVYYEAYKMQPAVHTALKQSIIFSSLIICEASLGFLSAFKEIHPTLISAFSENVPLIKSGFSTISTDLQMSFNSAAPVMYSAVVEVTNTSVIACSEIYPDVLAAASTVYPDIANGFCVVAPVLLRASTEVISDLFKALCVIAPSVQNSVCIVAPVAWSAARISIPVILYAGCNVSSGMSFALLELCRALQVALVEVSATSLKGSIVMKQDLINAYCVISTYRRHREDVPSFVNSSFHIMSSAVNEVNSLLWMVSRMKLRNNNLTFSQKHYEFGMLFHKSKKVVSSVCRTSCQAMAVTFGAAVFFNVCIIKSNMYAVSSAYKISLKLSRYYEKVEPKVMELAFILHMCLRSFLKLEGGEYGDSLENKEDQYLSDLKQTAVIFPQNLTFLQYLAREMCLSSFSVLAKWCDTIWKMFVKFSPWYWTLLTKCSPHIWNIICSVAPVFWSSFCSMNKNAWKYIRLTSPEAWNTFCTSCHSAWEYLVFVVPKLWRPLKEISPEVWSLICEISWIIWIRLCKISPVVWAYLCKHTPVIWQSLCRVTNILWGEYCDTISNFWHTFCSGADWTWKIQCFVCIFIWKFLMGNQSKVNALFGDLNSFVEFLLTLSRCVWFALCVFVILITLARHCDSIKDLFINSSFVNSTENVIVDDNKLNSAANYAFHTVLNNLSTVRVFVSDVRTTFNQFLVSVSNKSAISMCSEFPINCLSTSQKLLTFSLQRTYGPLIKKSRNLISSLQISTFCKGSIILPFTNIY